jgi:transposase
MRRTEKMKIVEMLRLSEMGLSQRKIGASAGCGKSTIGDLLRLCKEKNVDYEAAKRLTDEELHSLLYPESDSNISKVPVPDWKLIHEELAKHKNLNLQFMWEEYRTVHPEGLSYSRFCELYRQYRKATSRQVSLYHERKAGEIMEIDWMGDTLPCVVDENTGEVIEAHFFVSILGYSNYPYVEAFPNEKETSWISGHVNALTYYGGVPRMIVPDNCKTAVKTPRYCEPVINGAYWELAQHYEVAIVPARVRKPKDKPIVEQSVGWLETWLLGKLRNQRFFSFHELNKTILKYLGEVSTRPFQKREGSRQSEFYSIDKPALRQLPPRKYEIADVVLRHVGDNYHIEYDWFCYSVPYSFFKEQVVLRATKNTIEVLDKTQTRIASHIRRYSRSEGRYVTNIDHMPANHQAVHQSRQFDGERYRKWALNIGMNTYFIIDSLLASGKVEEQGYKSCMGVLQLSKKYSYAQLEMACKRARELGSYTYSTVSSLIKKLVQETSAPKPKRTPIHENIRGNAYYR